jgi:CHAT domain-containing protein/predicted negative regulator of RcsB-dependent stress response
VKRLPACLALLIVVAGRLLAQTGGDVAPAQAVESMQLDPGKAIERQLAGGQSHEYQLSLQAGQYARVRADQITINLSIVCFGPDGKERFAIDTSPIGDPEDAELIADASGIYRLRVMASEPQAPNGRYEIALRDMGPATERHRERVAAARAFAQGMESNRQGTRQAMLQAVDDFYKALAHWRAAEDHVEAARMLYTSGLTYIEIGDQQQALERSTQALALAQAANDLRAEARALNAIAEVHNYFGDKRKAIGYYEQALPLMRTSGDRAGEGNALNNLAVAYAHTGEKPKALTFFGQAEQIFRELHDRRMMAEVAGNLGVTLDNLGQYLAALESHQHNLALKRELGERGGQAIALNNIGTAYSGLGAYQKALDAYTAALEINRSLDNRRSVAINLNNVAWVYDQLADYRRAVAFYQESLEIVRALNDQHSIAVTLNNIAGIHTRLGNYDKALQVYTEALSLRRAVGDTDGEANSLNHIGNVLARLGKRDEAGEHFQRALAIFRTSHNPYMLARTLTNLAALNRKNGDYLQALAHLDEAVEINRTIRFRDGEAEALAELSRVEYARGNYETAHQRAESALSAFESVRLAVASPALRASFFASVRDIQELDIEILMRLHGEHPEKGFGAAALFASERGRARSLLELLHESSAEIRRDVDTALLERERELERIIARKAEQQTRSGKQTEAETIAAVKELDALATELEQVQSRIRETSPQYAALTHPVPLKLSEIQTKVLDGDTVLLEYALGSEKSFLWAVTPTSMDVFELGPRAEIESAVRRLFDPLMARKQKPAGETPAARARRIRQADQAYLSAAAKATRMLLDPVASKIERKRLLIVGEGVLQYLPFAALPEPGTGEQGKDLPLINNHEIITAPSASVMAVLRQETAGRRPAEKALLVLADPVFSADDARVVQKGTTVATASATESASRGAAKPAEDTGVQDLLRLRFSRHEAEEIARLTPPALTRVALDFDASRETVLSTDLGQYRIVHLATHSLLDNQRPELSGVVLSLVDRSGRPQNGFLRLYDIYNLRLGADLVVLSACQTARGGEIEGEGLIGLTRGFLYAGAPRVVATLWEVDDRTTALVMKHFYEGMLVRGQRPAAALRSAQAEVARTKGWDPPYYWAAFTLQGEWR